MKDIEREVARLEAKIRYAKKQIKDEQKAQEMKTEGFEPTITTCQKVFKEMKCGNCGEAFYYGEENSIWYLKEENLPNFCSNCGAKIKKWR